VKLVGALDVDTDVALEAAQGLRRSPPLPPSSPLDAGHGAHLLVVHAPRRRCAGGAEGKEDEVGHQ
jgi:hypothetical protein